MIESILKSHRVLICVGSGGVGKTTISASLGLCAAQLGLNVLVMTIDPSRRLRDALGLTEASPQDVLVPGQNCKGELRATLLNAEEIFKDFVLRSASHPELAERLLKNRLYKQLSTTLSGSQEFTSLLQLSKMVSQHKYDLIILDTPPAQHAVDFLEAPIKINMLFQDSIIKWFIGDEAGVGFIRRIISRGTKTVFRALEMMTGSVFMIELNDFFSSVRAVQQQIAERTLQVQGLLTDKTTGFILVTGFDEAKLKEAESLNQYLQDKKLHHVATIINKAFPLWLRAESENNLTLLQHEKIGVVYSLWRNYHAEREKLYKQFASKELRKLPIVQIRDFNQDISGIEGLEVVSHEVDRAFEHFRTVRV